MTPKQLKFLSLFEAMSKADSLAEANVKKHLTSFINHDYALALDVWDYLASTREQTLASDKEAAQTINIRPSRRSPRGLSILAVGRHGHCV